MGGGKCPRSQFEDGGGKLEEDTCEMVGALIGVVTMPPLSGRGWLSMDSVLLSRRGAEVTR